jgi:hypothetical protein
MKIFQLVCLFVLVCWFNLFGQYYIGQYYIGQDKIDQLKNSKNKSYRVGTDFKNTDNEVYLEGVGQDNYASDVMIGFDKLKYKRGETIILTFTRSGINSRVENENIMIVANNRISANFKVDSSNGYYVINLKPSETKKIYIHPKNRNQQLTRISLGIGQFGYTSEGRSYIIPYPPLLKKSSDSNETMDIPYEEFKSGLKRK